MARSPISPGLSTQSFDDDLQTYSSRGEYGLANDVHAYGPQLSDYGGSPTPSGRGSVTSFGHADGKEGTIPSRRNYSLSGGGSAAGAGGHVEGDGDLHYPSPFTHMRPGTTTTTTGRSRARAFSVLKNLPFSPAFNKAESRLNHGTPGSNRSGGSPYVQQAPFGSSDYDDALRPEEEEEDDEEEEGEGDDQYDSGGDETRTGLEMQGLTSPGKERKRLQQYRETFQGLLPLEIWFVLLSTAGVFILTVAAIVLVALG